MAKYVKVEDVIELINGLDSLPWEEETEELVNRLPTYDTDKVIEQVTERRLEYKDNDTAIGYKVAIEIIEAGGENGK